MSNTALQQCQSWVFQPIKATKKFYFGFEAIERVGITRQSGQQIDKTAGLSENSFSQYLFHIRLLGASRGNLSRRKATRKEARRHVQPILAPRKCPAQGHDLQMQENGLWVI